MNDDLDQLLKNLKLHRIREILERELKRAEKTHPSYSEFLARLLREQEQYRQERVVVYRIEQAQLPERWSLESFPFDRQSGVSVASVKQPAELDFVVQHRNSDQRNRPLHSAKNRPARRQAKWVALNVDALYLQT